MNFKKLTTQYHLSSLVLHWLMLALFVLVYASIELRVLFEKGTPARDLMKTTHFTLGLLMFSLVWLRLAMRARYAAPLTQPAPSVWQALAGKLAHVTLYLIMVGMPLAGWLILSAEGKPIPFFFLELPALIGKDKALAHQIQGVHELVGTVGYFLIGAHAAAALFHHYILRDSTLRQMLPRQLMGAGAANTH